MKVVSPAFQDILNSSTARLSTCLRIRANDGTIIGFTNNTSPLTFEGVTYRSVDGTTPTAIQSNNTLSVDNLDITTVRSPTGITGPDILRGRWDFADVRIFMLSSDDITAGALKVRRGRLGAVSLNRQTLTAEVRGMLDALTKQILELYSPGCRVDLGSTRCGVPLDPPEWTASLLAIINKPFDARIGTIVKPTVFNGFYFKCSSSGTTGLTEPTWNLTLGGTTVDNTAEWETITAFTHNGTVTSIFNTKRVVDTNLLLPTDFFTGGLVTWLTGLNIGDQIEVKSYVVTNGRLTFILPMWFDVAVNDTFTVTAGCFKRITEDCRDKFDNSHNFQGEPYVQQNFRISPARISQDGGGKGGFLGR